LEALVGRKEWEVLRLFAAEDESGSELESVGCAELMHAEEADGTGADFIGWGHFGPMRGQFVKVTAGAEFRFTG